MDISSPFIIFVIPSIGRESLWNTIKSLICLNDPNWIAIIIYDGVDNILVSDNHLDKRIKIYTLDKKEHSAGLVRNIGLDIINNNEDLKDCKWIGFVDDDDTISPNYIDNLKKEIDFNKDIDVCIFRMIYTNKMVIPSKYCRTIIRGNVGISFSIKKEISDILKFKNTPYEDFLYIKELQNKKYKIIISSFISYFVRGEPYDVSPYIYPRILIN